MSVLSSLPDTRFPLS